MATRQNRDTYIYHLLDGRGETVYIGFTNGPADREYEHRQSGKRFRTLEVRSVALTKGSARVREQEEIAYHVERHGDLPKYNKTGGG